MNLINVEKVVGTFLFLLELAKVVGTNLFRMVTQS